MRAMGKLMAAAATAAVLAAGCGGDDGGEELSATAFREQANAVCADLEKANEKTFDGVDSDDRDAVVKAGEEAGRRAEQALDDLGALDGPEESEALVDRFVARAREMGEAIERQGQALRDGEDADKAAQEADRLSDEIEKAGRDAGLDDCVS